MRFLICYFIVVIVTKKIFFLKEFSFLFPYFESSLKFFWADENSLYSFRWIFSLKAIKGSLFSCGKLFAFLISPS